MVPFLSLLTPPGTVVWSHMSNSLFSISQTAGKAEHFVGIHTRLLCCLLSRCLYKEMVGCVLEWFFYCLFWEVKNDSACLSASFVDAVQICLLVARGCCCSGTCSRASDGCRPLIKRFSNVLFLCSDRHLSGWPPPQTDTNLWSALHLLPGSTYDSPFTLNPSELSEVVCFPALKGAICSTAPCCFIDFCDDTFLLFCDSWVQPFNFTFSSI